MPGWPLPTFSTASAARPVNDPTDVTLYTPALEHSIEDEVFYFVLPDRFARGDASNDAGGPYPPPALGWRGPL